MKVCYLARVFVVLIAAAFLFGCVSTYQAPQQRKVENARLLSTPIENVWKAVVTYFADHNIPIENMDHSSYFIKTKPVDLTVSFAAPSYAGKKIPLKNEWCDCGEAKIVNVWSSNQQISFSFNIVLTEDNSEKTLATINVFFDGKKLGKRNAYASGYDIEMPLQCVSTGKLERDLLTYLESGGG